MVTEDSYMIPVIFHKLKGYASHLIMQYITREYAPARSMWYQPLQINVLPSKTAIYASWTVYNFSPRPSTLWSNVWLQMGMIILVVLLTIIQNSIWFSQRGITVTNACTEERDTFLLTELPPIDAFYSSLTTETITPEECDRSRKVWRELGIENMQQNDDLYRRPSASWCLCKFSAKVQLGLRTRPRAVL